MEDDRRRYKLAYYIGLGILHTQTCVALIALMYAAFALNWIGIAISGGITIYLIPYHMDLYHLKRIAKEKGIEPYEYFLEENEKD